MARIAECSLVAALALLLLLFAGVRGDDLPSESQCRPYIEKALKHLETAADGDEAEGSSLRLEETPYRNDGEVLKDNPNELIDSKRDPDGDSGEADDSAPRGGVRSEEDADSERGGDSEDDADAEQGGDSKEGVDVEEDGDSKEDGDSREDGDSGEDGDSKEGTDSEEGDAPRDNGGSEADDSEEAADSKQDDSERGADSKEDDASKEDAHSEDEGDSVEDADSKGEGESKEDADSKDGESKEDADSKDEESKEDEDSKDGESKENVDSKDGESKEDVDSKGEEESKEDVDSKGEEESKEDVDSKDEGDSKEDVDSKGEEESKEDVDSKGEEESKEDVDSKGEEESKEDVDSKDEGDSKEDAESKGEIESKDDADSEQGVESKGGEDSETDGDSKEDGDESASEESDENPEEDLLLEIDIPENLRSRDHIAQLLRLDEESTEAELLLEKSSDIILRELKRLYDNAIKPLEILYKYRDLSNRHFGDPEIFSKPLVLFMGPWSGGKSSLINYLTDNEFTEWSLRTGAEPSPAYFNILMYGDEPQVLDGTQLAADWTFSGLQKFGQGLEERLRGLKLPNKLLQRVNIVEIPGILEVRKQVSRVFPFNDACQWFIDRADVIFLVYDPSKLDVGPETEAILDQLKGRESQTRILLNKADQVKPEELMRVQGALIWNISPLMSSAQPPVMYTTSLWSMPFEQGAPVRLLQAQERAFLKDLRAAIDRRVENKIAGARRFAVRVRNHAKMVDCYLTTYYNHKTIFGNKRLVAEAIIEHPQNYHIYEGLSTLTNISRYDLPDPETYRDFFRLNPLYEFQQLSATCTYFRGCPINRLDVAIAYDLPELVGRYKKMVESATPQGMPKS